MKVLAAVVVLVAVCTAVPHHGGGYGNYSGYDGRQGTHNAGLETGGSDGTTGLGSYARVSPRVPPPRVPSWLVARPRVVPEQHPVELSDVADRMKRSADPVAYGGYGGYSRRRPNPRPLPNPNPPPYGGRYPPYGGGY